ncbi:hypothetical protein FNV43_RR06107 [Rhamnella rubrinervis]|uniref:2'-O-ribose RNA methyltransferase SPB1 homolog n=1 Tax=Rhamnella rubrinervis TaxID=2594499 RepID=A0A8K0HDY2_9ROSA|nr:hypothetical protein FNV43_RR06107 [Rhamnella rubrinervis]
MGKSKGKQRVQNDGYYWLAKETRYRSRASWKLVELDEKYGFLRSSHAVLDLCAAPGSWMQVAVNRVPRHTHTLVLGIDLVPIKPIPKAIAVKQDITKSECQTTIKRIMSEHGFTAFDSVLHDGSPNIGGAWAQEAMTQNALVIDAVKLATKFLSPKGTFVTKVFRSQDYNSVKYCLGKLFEKVVVHKPKPSRSSSAEIYVLGFKYLAPAKIDPRLLDVKHLFQGSVEPPRKVMDVLRGTKQKRHRDGYEEGNTTLWKVSTAADFISSNSPLDVLGSVTSITFEDQASLSIKDHDLTTEEVKTLCDDLHVLGKQDFKHLLKWRMHIRKALCPSHEVEATTARDVENENKVDEDDRILNVMEEMAHAVQRKSKRAKKLVAKRQAKDKARKATGTPTDALNDGYADHELFSLSSIKDKKDLVAVDSNEYDDENGHLVDSENEETREGTEEDSSSDLDSDEKRRRYDEKMEEFFDQAYGDFVAKKEGSTKQRKRAKQVQSEDNELMEGGNDEDVMQSDYNWDRDVGDQEGNPLMIPLDDGEGPTQEEITNKWFSQDIFAEAVEDGDFEKADSDDEMQIYRKEKKFPLPEKAKERAANHAVRSNQLQRQTSKAQDDFEIVPAVAIDSSDSSSDELEDEDVDSKAEILACAKKLLRKKQREQILDDGYKYMFDDEGPKWFQEEEKKHRQPIKPVTKEEIAAVRAQFKEIDARPAKKVAEAKARKKRAAMMQLKKVCKTANIISDRTDISERSKWNQIEQLYKKAMPKRPPKEFVVAKKGVNVRAGKGKVLVDRRMKKDARSRKTASFSEG